MSEADQMAHMDATGNPPTGYNPNKRYNNGTWSKNQQLEHWKYPETVGNDTYVDNINFNSHQSSEYAVQRMDEISETTSEPFMMFEFLTIDEAAAQEKIAVGNRTIKKVLGWAGLFRDEQTGQDLEAEAHGFSEYEIASGVGSQRLGEAREAKAGDELKNFNTRSFIENLDRVAERNYTGSIALYMPTDIQVNDTMMYNEDTRKLGAAITGLMGGGNDTEIFNWTVLSDPAVLATAGAAVSKLSGLATLLTGGIGAIAQKELQRNTGKVMNPNELLRYAQTALRTFTFNWIILPDNAYESDQAAGLIRFFRKSAHAKRTSSTLVTVPDHVVTSFHGAKDMIQLPPCFIESVNVTYNPNVSSFFKRNNAPVEIGLSITIKEIVPIYAADIDRGY